MFDVERESHMPSPASLGIALPEDAYPGRRRETELAGDAGEAAPRLA